MIDFDTDDVWDSLAETGKYRTLVDFCDLHDFRSQLHAEARAENVQLRINVEGSPSRLTLYVYLRRFR